jgi:hypothetical protein
MHLSVAASVGRTDQPAAPFAWMRSSRPPSSDTRRGRHASVWPGARQTPARDDEQACRSSLLLLDRVRAVARAAPHVALAAMRAITHVVGKAIRSSRRARRGAGCWLRTTMAPPAGADIEQPDCLAAGVGRPRMGVPVGEGSARRRLGRSRDGRPRARFAPAFARGCVVRTRPDGALACRPTEERRSRQPTRSLARERGRGVVTRLSAQGCACGTAAAARRVLPFGGRGHASGTARSWQPSTPGTGCSRRTNDVIPGWRWRAR